jgi:hypothetical protein
MPKHPHGFTTVLSAIQFAVVQLLNVGQPVPVVSVIVTHVEPGVIVVGGAVIVVGRVIVVRVGVVVGPVTVQPTVRSSVPQPPWHAVGHGVYEVDVGTIGGQVHGLLMVESWMQSGVMQCLVKGGHSVLAVVFVMVGQWTATN